MKKKTQKKEKIYKINSKMQASLLLVFCAILVAFVVLIGRIIYWGRVKGDAYKKKVLEQQSFISSETPYKRGSIIDRNGLILATSSRVYNVILDPYVIATNSKYEAPTVKALVKVFDMTETEVKTILTENASSQYKVILRHIPLEKVEEFEALQKQNRYIKGVWFEDDFIRTYPYENLASHVVGFTASGNQGLYGLELYYNKILNGTNGRSYGYFDSELNLQKTERKAIDGYNIVTTINGNVQSIIQGHIDEFQETVGSKNFGVIVMNPNNGEIIAMATSNEYDLNNPRDLSAFYNEEELEAMTAQEKTDAMYAIWHNFCIESNYEPGSVFKPFTVGAMFEENLTNTKESFNCTGYRYKGGWKIYCNARYGHGLLNPTQSIMFSCNCALMDMVERLGRTNFYKYQTNFGFGKRTGIDLPSEGTGMLVAEDKLNVTELATSGFGQTFTLTMIQMISGFSSLVNGGNYYLPHLVSEITDADGKTIEKIEPLVVRKTISENTSDFLRDALTKTVTDGLAKKAAVKGYLVGGKTGTAQKLPRADKKYIVSFLATVPADNPQYLMYVVIDEPDDPKYYNSSYHATTMTSKILKDILPHLGIFPNGEIDYNIDFDTAEDEVTDLIWD